MPRTPAVVNTLSRLGNVACQHDKDLGIRVFEKAYSVAAGLNFDLSEESSVILLSTLVSRASNCHPEFGVRSPTGREDLSRLQPRARLRTTLDAVRTDPAAAAGFAHDVAETLSNLNTGEQQAFVSALTILRQQRPSEADAVFQHALRKVASSGSVADLFALGNYIFGPQGAELGSDVVRVIPVPEGNIYGFAETRPGVPDELANRYIASSSAALAGQAPLAQEDTLAFGLTKQLQSWAESHAPHQAPTLTSLLGDQRARLAQTQGLSRLERIGLLSGKPSPGFEERIDSAPDEPTKASLRFHWAYIKISRGELEKAREIVAELEDEIRPPLLDIIALKEVRKMIDEGDLEAARLGLSTLNDKLHLVLGALSLASAHWNLSDESGNRVAEDAQAAADAIQLAGSATAQIPDEIRPKIRVAIAEALALPSDSKSRWRDSNSRCRSSTQIRRTRGGPTNRFPSEYPTVVLCTRRSLVTRRTGPLTSCPHESGFRTSPVQSFNFLRPLSQTLPAWKGSWRGPSIRECEQAAWWPLPRAPSPARFVRSGNR